MTVTYQTAPTAGPRWRPTRTTSAVTATSVTFPPRGPPPRAVSPPTTSRDLNNDTEDEDDEIFALVAACRRGTPGLGDAEGTGTIVDRDPPALRIEDATAEEGDTLVFRVRLGIRDEFGTFVETPTSETVSVNATTEDGTATAPGDYIAKTQPLEFTPSVTSLDFTVTSNPDNEPESPETFWVDLSGAQNALLDRAGAKGTIDPNCIDINDDTQDPPTITLFPAEVREGQIEQITVGFSQPLCDEATVVRGHVYNSTATSADTSYSPDSWSRIPASRTEWPPRPLVSVQAVLDGVDEDDEEFTFRLGWLEPNRPTINGRNPDDLMPGHYWGRPWASATVTIVDGDPEPGLRISDAAASEGQPLTFEVTLAPASGRTVTVQYRTVDGSGTAAAGDYTPVDWTSLVFDPGDTSLSFEVATALDADVVDDTFLVELRALDPTDPDFVPINARIEDAIAVGTILEGGQPTLRIHDAQAVEASDGGDGQLSFLVELSAPAVQPVTVDYETVQRPKDVGAATAGADYTHVDRDLTFNVNEQFKTVEVQSLYDEEPEGNETFLVELSNQSSGVSLADPSAVGTIIDDEVQCVDPTTPGIDPMPYTARGESVVEGAATAS